MAVTEKQPNLVAILYQYLIILVNILSGLARHTINREKWDNLSLLMIQNTLRRVKLTLILSLKLSWAKYWTDLSENLEKSVSVEISKMYKIGISIGMLFFRNKKSVSICYLILKIGIGRVKSSKSVRISIGKNRFKVNRSILQSSVFSTSVGLSTKYLLLYKCHCKWSYNQDQTNMKLYTTL